MCDSLICDAWFVIAAFSVALCFVILRLLTAMWLEMIWGPFTPGKILGQSQGDWVYTRPSLDGCKPLSAQLCSWAEHGSHSMGHHLLPGTQSCVPET